MRQPEPEQPLTAVPRLLPVAGPHDHNKGGADSGLINIDNSELSTFLTTVGTFNGDFDPSLLSPVVNSGEPIFLEWIMHPHILPVLKQLLGAPPTFEGCHAMVKHPHPQRHDEEQRAALLDPAKFGWHRGPFSLCSTGTRRLSRLLRPYCCRYPAEVGHRRLGQGPRLQEHNLPQQHLLLHRHRHGKLDPDTSHLTSVRAFAALPTQQA